MPYEQLLYDCLVGLPLEHLRQSRYVSAIYQRYGCTVASGVVGVVVVVVGGVCNRSQMRTSKCTCSIFGVSIGLDPGQKCTKGIFDMSKFKVTHDISPTISGWLLVVTVARSALQHCYRIINKQCLCSLFFSPELSETTQARLLSLFEVLVLLYVYNPDDHISGRHSSFYSEGKIPGRPSRWDASHRLQLLIIVRIVLMLCTLLTFCLF